MNLEGNNFLMIFGKRQSAFAEVDGKKNPSQTSVGMIETF